MLPGTPAGARVWGHVQIFRDDLIVVEGPVPRTIRPCTQRSLPIPDAPPAGSAFPFVNVEQSRLVLPAWSKPPTRVWLKTGLIASWVFRTGWGGNNDGIAAPAIAGAPSAGAKPTRPAATRSIGTTWLSRPCLRAMTVLRLSGRRAMLASPPLPSTRSHISDAVGNGMLWNELPAARPRAGCTSPARAHLLLPGRPRSDPRNRDGRFGQPSGKPAGSRKALIAEGFWRSRPAGSDWCLRRSG